jgi:hypothetical protein
MTKRLVCTLAIFAAAVWAQQPVASPQPAGANNIELTVYLLSGGAQSGSDEVPADLESTVKQLHSLFTYKSYKLAESFLLRGRKNSGSSAQGVLPGSGLHYDLRYQANWDAGTPSSLIHINALRLSLTRTGPMIAATKLGKESTFERQTDTVASISTDLDIREGQKTVVGKSSVNSTGDALILVIVPKLVD